MRGIRNLEPITEVTDAHSLIEIVATEGGALIRNCVDINLLDQAIKDAGLRDSQLTVVDDGKSEAVAWVLEQVDVLAELNSEMRAKKIPLFNCVSIAYHELGSSLAPHADALFECVGLTVMFPRWHIGHVILHGDDRFDVTPFYRNSKNRLTRQTVPKEAGTGLIAERGSEYGRGDMLAIRQDLKEKDWSAKVHSANSKRRLKDHCPFRPVLAFDHYVKSTI